jgi:anti-anti-sigma factor
MSAEEGRSHSLRWFVDRQHGLCTVRLEGELDMPAGDALSAVLDPLLAHGSTVVLDLDAVTFMDSTGIRVLGNARRQGDEAGCRFLLARPSPVVRRILHVAGLLEYFSYVEGAPPSELLCSACESWVPATSVKCLHCGATL